MPVYVQHEVIGKINDVFNADAIWQAPGMALFARRPLLRDLLERSPREQRGRAATRCFSHVTLMLPQDDVDDDRHLTRGARVRDLAASLTALHQKDFGDLLAGEDVRYDVIGAPALEAGQIEVKFGHAVYLPAPAEKVQYLVSTSRDSAIWQPVCPIHANQRLTLIGQDAQCATHAVPGWPFGADGAILLINDGPDTPIEVQLRPKEAFDCSFDPLNGYYTIKSKRGGVDAAGATPRLLLKLTRMAAAPQPQAQSPGPAPASASARPAAVWTTRHQGRDAAEQTAVPLSHRPARKQAAESDATYAPVAAQRVSLVALALPRLSRYRETGALALEVGLDRLLAPAAHGKDMLIGFAVDTADDIHATTAAGRQRIEIPASFTPLEGSVVRLLDVAPAMADRYRALLCLPQPPGLPVAHGARFVFGRSAPMLAALRVLDSPRFLRRAEGADAASADRLGLSRDAFSFEAVANGYRISRLSANQALYHLDEQLRFVACIAPAAPEQPYLLPPGHHLVAGHYVLRFDA